MLLTLAIAWWRTDLYGLLLAHYGLSLAGVLFEVYFLYLQVFVIGAVCVWCTRYGLSLIAALRDRVRGLDPSAAAGRATLTPEAASAAALTHRSRPPPRPAR